VSNDAVVATTPASISGRRRRDTSGWRILAAALVSIRYRTISAALPRAHRDWPCCQGRPSRLTNASTVLREALPDEHHRGVHRTIARRCLGHAADVHPLTFPARLDLCPQFLSSAAGVVGRPCRSFLILLSLSPFRPTGSGPRRSPRPGQTRPADRASQPWVWNARAAPSSRGVAQACRRGTSGGIARDQGTMPASSEPTFGYLALSF
jgi:hypothetical protein